MVVSGGGVSCSVQGSCQAEDMTSERKRISSGSPYEATIGFSRAIHVADRVIVSGTAPIWPDGACDPDPKAQARRCFEIIAAALGEAGSDLADVVRTRMYITDASLGDAVGEAHSEVFSAIRPAATMVVVAGLLDQRWKVEIEAEAVVQRPAASALRSTALGREPSSLPHRTRAP